MYVMYDCHTRNRNAANELCTHVVAKVYNLLNTNLKIIAKNWSALSLQSMTVKIKITDQFLTKYCVQDIGFF